MFASLISNRIALEKLSREFDAASLCAVDAVRAVEELGAIRRVVDGMLAQAAKRVADTNAHAGRGERNAATMVARKLGITPSEARAAIDTASKLEALALTAAAVRDGELSARAAQMVADAAMVNPGAERELLSAAEKGLIPLKDACIAARARVEGPDERAKRQRSQRRLGMWVDADGMVAGAFRLTPEVGGQVKAAVDAAVQRIFRSRRAGTDHEAHEAYAADALAEFVLTRASAAPVADPDTEAAPEPSTAKSTVDATVHIVIDHGALMRGGAVGGEVCEIPGVGPVDVSWVRELLGSAFLTAVIKRGKDILTVAHLGRHVPAEVQTALVVSGRECDIGNCHVRGYLERDHVHDHAQGGPTSFANLGWLCYWHHRLKSAGWQLGPADPVTRKRTLRPPTARAA